MVAKHSLGLDTCKACLNFFANYYSNKNTINRVSNLNVAIITCYIIVLVFLYYYRIEARFSGA